MVCVHSVVLAHTWSHWWDPAWDTLQTKKTPSSTVQTLSGSTWATRLVTHSLDLRTQHRSCLFIQIMNVKHGNDGSCGDVRSQSHYGCFCLVFFTRFVVNILDQEHPAAEPTTPSSLRCYHSSCLQDVKQQLEIKCQASYLLPHRGTIINSDSQNMGYI